MANANKILLFGGQGSLKDLFCPQGTSTAFHNVKSSPAAAILLSKRHAVFLADVQTLGAAKPRLFGHEADLLLPPENLLAPDVVYDDNPIIQETPICLHQLLRYLSNLEECGLKHEPAFGQIVDRGDGRILLRHSTSSCGGFVTFHTRISRRLCGCVSISFLDCLSKRRLLRAIIRPLLERSSVVFGCIWSRQRSNVVAVPKF